jgi:hypothetical protein
MVDVITIPDARWRYELHVRDVERLRTMLRGMAIGTNARHVRLYRVEDVEDAVEMIEAERQLCEARFSRNQSLIPLR